MSEQAERSISRWLYTLSVIIVGLVVFGGFVRLTRSGLSIVEWNVISGVLPPIGEQAWLAEFAKYQLTPEYQKVNMGMSLTAYKEIFYLEYFHRLIARFAGLVVILPLGYFLWRGTIPWRKSGIYILIAVLFVLQGVMGWYMVSSGLENRPAVSHFRLTIHLFLAIILLAITLWKALDLTYGASTRGGSRTAPFWLAMTLMGVLTVQILYGGLVAGLKAGHASDTWPLMFGYLIPPGMLSMVQPWWRNLLEVGSVVHFTHRWFAWAVFIVSVVLYLAARGRGYSGVVQRGLAWMMALIGAQIALGVSVIWFHVPVLLALSHQFSALVLFVVTLFLIHRIQGETVAQPGREWVGAQATVSR